MGGPPCWNQRSKPTRHRNLKRSKLMLKTSNCGLSTEDGIETRELLFSETLGVGHLDPVYFVYLIVRGILFILFIYQKSHLDLFFTLILSDIERRNCGPVVF